MSRSAPWLVAVAGVLLAGVGVVLAVRGGTVDEELRFLSPEQFEVLRGASRRAELGRLLLVSGAAVLGALGGLVLSGRWTVRGAVSGGLLAAALVGAAVVLLQPGDGAEVAVYSGSYEPLGCADWPVCDGAAERAPGDRRWAGAGTALVGGLLLGGVTGRLLGGDRRVDQR